MCNVQGNARAFGSARYIVTLTVAIDPGKHGCGFATYLDGVLVHAAYVSGLGGAAHPLLEVAGPVGALVDQLLAALAYDKVDELVIERPQVYDAPQQRGDQNDLIDLAVVVGGLLGTLSGRCRASLLVRPAEWKGQTPKDITETRAKARLSTSELAAIELPKAKTVQHNVWDAVALGLWRLGR